MAGDHWRPATFQQLLQPIVLRSSWYLPWCILGQAHFCKAFPVIVPHSALAGRGADIWATSAELLYLAAGDHEEHANLLAGYFIEAGHQVWTGVMCLPSPQVLSRADLSWTMHSASVAHMAPRGWPLHDMLGHTAALHEPLGR